MVGKPEWHVCVCMFYAQNLFLPALGLKLQTLVTCILLKLKHWKIESDHSSSLFLSLSHTQIHIHTCMHACAKNEHVVWKSHTCLPLLFYITLCYRAGYFIVVIIFWLLLLLLK